MVGDGVQHAGRAAVQQLGLVLEPLAHLGERAVPAVPYGHHEVGADEHHDLAGGDDLAGGGQLVVVEVGDGLEHHEQRVAVALDLGPLMGLDRVLDGRAGAGRTRSASHSTSGAAGSCRPTQTNALAPSELAVVLADQVE